MSERPPTERERRDLEDERAVRRMMREIREAPPPQTGGSYDFWELPIAYLRQLRHELPNTLVATIAALPFVMAIWFVMAGADEVGLVEGIVLLALVYGADIAVKLARRNLRIQPPDPGPDEVEDEDE